MITDVDVNVATDIDVNRAVNVANDVDSPYFQVA
jgi:hypothetical protein